MILQDIQKLDDLLHRAVDSEIIARQTETAAATAAREAADAISALHSFILRISGEGP